MECKGINEAARKQKKVFYFDGFYVEEAFDVPAPDVEWSEAENFYLFVKNYERKQEQYFDHYFDQKFKFYDKNPYMNIDEPLSLGMNYSKQCKYFQAFLCYEAAIQKNKYCVVNAFYLMKQCLPIYSDIFLRKLYCYLIDEQYYYQGCQVIFDWLKNHADYCHIVPPNFTMEPNKPYNLIEEEQLKALQNMLMIAAERYAIKRDYNVQIALSVLTEISRDYNQIGEYWKVLPQNGVAWKNYELIVGIHLLRSNEPEKAISLLEKLDLKYPSLDLFKARCKNTLGLSYMYLKHYKKAGQYLLAAIDIAKTWSYIPYQLGLCTKLMRRNDLFNLVNKEAFQELSKEFNYQPIHGEL